MPNFKALLFGMSLFLLAKQRITEKFMREIQFKYLNPLSMLYMTIKLMTAVLIYKIISIGSFSASASTIIMPLWFVIGDIITEVYGYKLAKQLIWIAIIFQFLFAFACSGLINLNAPMGWPHQDAYNQVLGKLPRVALASFMAIVSGAFINAYIISKWKIILCGKYFWLRSLGASAAGELFFTIIAYTTEFGGILPFQKLIHLIIISYVIKLILNPILIIPSSFLVFLLKKYENIDKYDVGVNFNPFMIDTNSNHSIINEDLNEIHNPFYK